MSKVSVIMPIYNTEKYLGEAIESVLNQTFSDFELLLINDASTDRSKEICVEYAAKDNRIVLLENNSENHGPGPTRNIGLDYASGDYIYFMDADDWAEVELLEQAVKRIEIDRSDMVVFGNYDEFYGTLHKSQKSPIYSKSIWTKEEIVADILEYWKVRSVALWSHLICRTTIGDVRFESIPLGEDFCFFLDLLEKVKSISYLNQWLYHYRTLSGSICHQWNDNVVECQCIKWEHEKKFLQSIDMKITKKEYSEILITSYLRIIYELALPWCPLKYSEKWRKINQVQKYMELENYRKHIDLDGKSGLEKIKAFLVKYKMDRTLLVFGMIVLKWRD